MHSYLKITLSTLKHTPGVFLQKNTDSALNLGVQFITTDRYLKMLNGLHPSLPFIQNCPTSGHPTLIVLKTAAKGVLVHVTSPERSHNYLKISIISTN